MTVFAVEYLSKVLKGRKIEDSDILFGTYYGLCLCVSLTCSLPGILMEGSVEVIWFSLKRNAMQSCD